MVKNLFAGLMIFLLACANKGSKNSEKLLPAVVKDSAVTVYVIEPNGISIYQSPSLTSSVVSMAAYCDSLQMFEHVIADSVTVTIMKPFNDTIWGNSDKLVLKAKWVQINYRGKTGFVPDVYLSQLPFSALLHKKYADIETNFDDIYFCRLNLLFGIKPDKKQAYYKHWLNGKLQPAIKNNYSLEKINANSGGLAEYSVDSANEHQQSQTTFYYNYTNGLKYSYSDDYVDDGIGGYTIELRKPGITFNEAIMWCRSFFYDSDANNTAFMKLIFTKEEGKYTFSYDSEGSECNGRVWWDVKEKCWVILFGCSGC